MLYTKPRSIDACPPHLPRCPRLREEVDIKTSSLGSFCGPLSTAQGVRDCPPRNRRARTPRRRPQHVSHQTSRWVPPASTSTSTHTARVLMLTLLAVVVRLRVAVVGFMRPPSRLGPVLLAWHRPVFSGSLGKRRCTYDWSPPYATLLSAARRGWMDSRIAVRVFHAPDFVSPAPFEFRSLLLN